MGDKIKVLDQKIDIGEAFVIYTAKRDDNNFAGFKLELFSGCVEDLASSTDSNMPNTQVLGLILVDIAKRISSKCPEGKEKGINDLINILEALKENHEN